MDDLVGVVGEQVELQIPDPIDDLPSGDGNLDRSSGDRDGEALVVAQERELDEIESYLSPWVERIQRDGDLGECRCGD